MVETGEGAIEEAALANRYVGAIDQLVQGRLSGWAVSMLGDPCEVAIRLNGEAVATVTSDGPRPDLHAKQQSRGLGGWHCDLGARLKPGENRIEALLPDGNPVPGSPLLHDGDTGPSLAPIPPNEAGPKTFVGAIDTPDGKTISGWAIGSDFKAAYVLVQVNDRPAMRIDADRDRTDLIAQKLTSAGGGWRFDAEPLMVPGVNRIAITFPNGQHLPGSPIERVIGGSGAGPTAPAPKPVAAVPASPAAGTRVSPFGRAVRDRAAAAPPAVVPETAAAPSPMPVGEHGSNVTPFPVRAGGKTGMPSLAELDELSLDDLSLAVAKGMINVTPPVADPVSAPEQPVEADRTGRSDQRGRGFFARLFGRG